MSDRPVSIPAAVVGSEGASSARLMAFPPRKLESEKQERSGVPVEPSLPTGPPPVGSPAPRSAVASMPGSRCCYAVGADYNTAQTSMSSTAKVGNLIGMTDSRRRVGGMTTDTDESSAAGAARTEERLWRDLKTGAQLDTEVDYDPADPLYNFQLFRSKAKEKHTRRKLKSMLALFADELPCEELAVEELKEAGNRLYLEKDYESAVEFFYVVV